MKSENIVFYIYIVDFEPLIFNVGLKHTRPYPVLKKLTLFLKNCTNQKNYEKNYQ